MLFVATTKCHYISLIVFIKCGRMFIHFINVTDSMIFFVGVIVVFFNVIAKLCQLYIIKAIFQHYVFKQILIMINRGRT